MKLYTHYRSSASYRIRIALNLKGIAAEHVFVDLEPGRSEQRGAVYSAINPQRTVPALELDDGTVLTQTLAILEFLEETFPKPPLLPTSSLLRTRVREICLVIAADTHPLHTTRVFGYLADALHADPATIDRWTAHWIAKSLTAVEKLIAGNGYCVGDNVTMAEVLVVPEVFAARRFKVDLVPYERIRRVEETCGVLEAFARAHPTAQPDAR